VGFLNAVAGLIAIGAFYAAAGVSLSLVLGERKQTNDLILLVALYVLPLSGLAILLPGTASLFLGAYSSPFLIWSSLFSYEDVQTLMHSRVLPQLGPTSIKPGVSARMVLASCWFATGAHAAGAFFLTRIACRRFDALVGRTMTFGFAPSRKRIGIILTSIVRSSRCDWGTSRWRRPRSIFMPIFGRRKRPSQR
jgi:hypothetical protein